MKCTPQTSFGFIAIDVTKVGQQQQITIPNATALFLLKQLLQAGAVVSNPSGPVFAITFEPFGTPLLFGIADGLSIAALGNFNGGYIYVTVISNPNDDDTLYLGYSQNLGLVVGDHDGLSPNFGSIIPIAGNVGAAGSQAGKTE